MAFEVHVVDDEDRGIEGVRVVIGFAFGQSDAEYTDGDGVAEFEGYDAGEVTVFLDGRDCGRHRYADGDSVTITQ